MTPIPEPLRLSSARGRIALAATVLSSGMVFLDSTVVNVALPTIGRDFNANVTGLQWIVNGYMLTLSALLLLGGALGDRLGRRRVLLVGLAGFAAASALCGAAPSEATLIAARFAQGVGGALLVPASLAIIEATFHPADRARAIGLWSGFAGIAAALGPFLAGWLIEVVSWRAAFVINLPLALVAAWAARRIPETRGGTGRLDIAGAVTAGAGLAAIAWCLTEAGSRGVRDPAIVASAAAAVILLAGFCVIERRAANPLVPAEVASSPAFRATNAITLFAYASLTGMFFLLPTELQIGLGLSPLQAGAALMPITLVMLVVSPRAARISERIGPRLPLAIGLGVAASGMLALSRASPGDGYLTGVLPGVLLFAFGISFCVAPLTVTMMASVARERAGMASAINNAVSRVAGLLAVAALPLAAGIAGSDYRDADRFTHGYAQALLICAASLACAVVITLVAFRTRPAVLER